MATKITSRTDEMGTTASVIKPTTSWQGLIAGMLLFIVGGFIIAVDSFIAISNKQALHTTHLLIGGGFCLGGVVVAFGAVVLPRLGGLSVVVAPYVPKWGGNRPGDPQVDGSIIPPKPPTDGPPTSPTSPTGGGPT
jgi:hypothetical protein